VNPAAKQNSLIWLLLVIASIWIIVTAPPLENDMGQFLPSAVTPQQALMLDEISQGTGSRLFLLAVSGGEPAHLDETSRTLKQKLSNTSHFQQVLNGESLIDEKTRQLLLDYRYLLIKTEITQETLHNALLKRLRELTSPVGMPGRRYLSNDPTAVSRKILARWTSNNGAVETRGIWRSPDNSQILLMLQSHYPATALEQQAAATESIRRAFDTLPDHGRLNLTITGPPYFGVESRRIIRQEARSMSLYASIGVALLLLFSFRSLRLLLLAALPLASGVLAGTATVLLTFNSMHAITLAFGITLIGVAVDYPIHLFTHLRHGECGEEAMQRVWPILRLGLITTALGFSALLLTDFGGLAQLGAFAVAGLLAAALATRYLLPTLTPENVQTNPFERPVRRLFSAQSSTRHRSAIPLVILVLSGLTVFLSGEQLWEHDLRRLSPISAETREQDQQLRQQLGEADTGRLLIISGTSADDVLQQSEQLESLLEHAVKKGLLSRFDLPSRLLPSHRIQLENRNRLPDRHSLQKDLAQAAAGMPFKAGLFTPFLDDVAKARKRTPLSFEQLESSPLGLRLSAQLQRKPDGKWRGLIPLTGVSDEPALEQLVAHAGISIAYLNLHRDTSDLVGSYRDEALHLAGMGGVVILFVLLFALRNLSQLVRVTLPVATAVLTTAALLALLGEQLSLFHIAALLLVLGIGLDYALFVAYTPTSDPAFPATLSSLLICNLSTLLVFGLLAATSVPVLSAIGLTVLTGAVFSLIFSVSMVHNETHP